MATKTYSIIDLVSGGYVAWRGIEPVWMAAKGEWTQEQAMLAERYRFGFIGHEGEFNWRGSAETYLPPLFMQLAKKALRWAGMRGVRLGPLRLP